MSGAAHDGAVAFDPCNQVEQDSSVELPGPRRLPSTPSGLGVYLCPHLDPTEDLPAPELLAQGVRMTNPPVDPCRRGQTGRREVRSVGGVIVEGCVISHRSDGPARVELRNQAVRSGHDHAVPLPA
jgi:hypothetical protein